MSAPNAPSPRLLPPHRRRVGLVLGIVALVTVGVLAAFFVPLRSETHYVQAGYGSASAVDLSVPYPTWVTVHFSHPNGVRMMYYMNGPGGMMFNHGMMSGADTYSFGSWGGTYHCGVQLEDHYSGMMPIWVNVTYGMI